MIGHNSQRRQTVYRTHGNRAYTAILNSFLQDGRISHEAKGLIAEMLSYPSDWDFTVAYIIKNGQSGRDKVYRMLKEGEKFGYIIPFKYRALDGKIQKQTYLVSDDPQELIKAVAVEIHELEKLACDNPVPEKPEMDKSLPTNQVPEKPDPEIQEVATQLPEKPLPAKATSGKTAYDKEIYKDKETKDKERAKTTRLKRGNKSRLSPDWVIDLEWRARTKQKFGLTDAQIDKEAERFKRYWISADAKNPMKADWLATWENWIDRAMERGIHVNGHANGASYGRNGNWTGTLY